MPTTEPHPTAHPDPVGQLLSLLPDPDAARCSEYRAVVDIVTDAARAAAADGENVTAAAHRAAAELIRQATWVADLVSPKP